MRMDVGTTAAAAGIGVLAGMRSLAAPATLSARLSNDGITRRSPAPLRAFGSPKTARALRALAVAEMGADKLPFMPDRTSPAGLTVRLLSGAVCGAAIASWQRDSAVLGALVGAAAAAAASYGFLALRKALSRSGPLKLATGFAEDALVAGGYWAAQKALR